MKKEQTQKLVGDTLSSLNFVVSGRVYGSWLCDESSVDLDIAVVLESKDGVVQSDHYRSLRYMREELVSKTGFDIDLVPHTVDEFDDLNSPIWYPRYNPSLWFGQDLKGSFQVSPVSDLKHRFGFAELTAYILHDNRTICRRQLVRSLNAEEGRIYISKLLHGPRNALTYHACKHQTAYKCSPSELSKCCEEFDKTYDVDSRRAVGFLRSCKAAMSFEKALMVMTWYENLVNLVLKGCDYRETYLETCRILEDNP